MVFGPYLRFRHCVKSVQIRSFSSSNTGKHGPKKLRIWILFTQWDLTFNERMKDVINKGNRTITSLFVKPILEYPDISILDKNVFKIVQ